MIRAAVPRERPLSLLETIWGHRIGMVVAPAGSGKTTFLADFAATSDAPVAWYQAEACDRRQIDLLRHLEAALTAALGPLTGDWTTVEGAGRALEHCSRRAAVIVDDLHFLQGTAAEAALERLAGYLPRGLTLVVASRYPPGFNLPRLRVAGDLLEMTRRTEGWAAGLQLFHLATRGKPPAARRRPPATAFASRRPRRARG